MKTSLSPSRTAGLPVQSDLRAGIQIRDLDSFTHAFIEEIAINDPQLIPDALVEKCASGFKSGLACVTTLNALGGNTGILSDALNTVVEQCKQEGLYTCDQWGDLFGVPFGHG